MTVKKTETKAAAVPAVAQAVAAAAPNETLTPATDVAASGAFIEPEIVDGINIDHPAVDNSPRAGAPAASNQIDFNDPTLSQEEAVARNLGANIEDAGGDE